jgi:nudix-type nucleoside diphosphatase (YffH/AdpP family)
MYAIAEHVRIRSVRVLSDDWYVLKKTTFDLLRHDGSWQTLSRETYDRGNGAVALLYNRQRRTVVFVRQFRYPALVNGHPDGFLIEACAGLLDNEAPDACMQREVEEETGYRVENLTRVFDVYMSPGSVTEKLFFYVGEYKTSSTPGSGGGEKAEGEDIEVLEIPFERALQMIRSGEIQDAKTIMLLLYLQTSGIFEARG